MIKIQSRFWNIALIALAQVLCIALWFSVTAAIPSIRAAHNITDSHAALLTSIMSVGFVIGTFASAYWGIADKYRPERLIQIAGLSGAILTGAALFLEPTSFWVVFLRLLTGMALAGVYPVGMKMILSWSDVGRGGHSNAGLLVGLLVGALTLGTALPHAFVALGSVLDWRSSILMSVASAGVGAILIAFAKSGPDLKLSPSFSARAARRIWTDPATRLANFGYLGHVWELYGMWAWIGLFVWHSHSTFLGPSATPTTAYVGSVTFLIIGAGAIGCFWGGWVADRIGRTWFTSLAMAISGMCALLVGLTFGLAPYWLISLGLVWGFFIVADSAQFSACIKELNPPEYAGTMLSAQTGFGFLLTLVSIYLTPLFADWWGWQWAFLPLTIGPVLGVVAMLRLRQMPEAHKIANGRR